MRRLLQLALLSLVVVCGIGTSHADPDPVSLIAEASAALDAGDYPRAEGAVGALLGRERLRREERAEAYRLLGLLKFYQESFEEARAAFLDYLRLDPDAHLDPALVPPEAITLLEDVRSKNLAEIESMRPIPPKKRYGVLNLVPVAGQFQNGDNTKGWIVGAGFVTLLAGNLGSYLYLKSYCSNDTRTCEKDGVDKTETARDLRALNLMTGVGLVTVYLYSAIDGYLGYRKLEARDRARVRANDMSLHVSATPEATTLSLSFRY
jgi:tetratricopeptide (TPR) repeat protein